MAGSISRASPCPASSYPNAHANGEGHEAEKLVPPSTKNPIRYVEGVDQKHWGELGASHGPAGWANSVAAVPLSRSLCSGLRQ